MAQKPEWAVRLSEALKQWCPRNGYLPMNRLAAELDIPPGVWTNISAGASIAENTTIYARLFLLTHLPEADPRTIPPRKQFIPKSRMYIDHVRAWTEEEWQDWLTPQSSAKETTPAPADEESTSPPSPPPTYSPDLTVGGILGQGVDTLLTRIAEQIGSQVASIVSRELTHEEPQTPPPTPREWTVRELLTELYYQLEPYKTRSRADMEKELGKQTLQDIGVLLNLLNILTLSDTKRQEALRLGKEFNA